MLLSIEEIFACMHTNAVTIQDDAQTRWGRCPIHRGIYVPIQGAYGSACARPCEFCSLGHPVSIRWTIQLHYTDSKWVFQQWLSILARRALRLASGWLKQRKSVFS